MGIAPKQISSAGAAPGDVLVWDGTQWNPASAPGGATPHAEQLGYSDTVNKVVGPLAHPPVVNEVVLIPLNGVPQEWTVDFTVRQVVGGTSPGYYICLDPSSTAPNGGSFSGGSNPTTGIVSQLEVGNKLQIMYSTL